MHYRKCFVYDVGWKESLLKRGRMVLSVVVDFCRFWQNCWLFSVMDFEKTKLLFQCMCITDWGKTVKMLFVNLNWSSLFSHAFHKMSLLALQILVFCIRLHENYFMNWGIFSWYLNCWLMFSFLAFPLWSGLEDYMKRYGEGIKRVLTSFGPVPDLSVEGAKSIINVSTIPAKGTVI